MSSLFLRRPRLLVLTLLLIVVSGLAALASLPRAEDPELSGRNAMVFAPFPGASAERVEALVTEPIERALREIEEIKELVSTSRAGLAAISVELHDAIGGSETDRVWSLVRDELGEVAPELPRSALAPELEEFEISAYTLIVGLGAEAEDAADPGTRAVLSRQAEDLADRLRGLSGTQSVDLYGEAEEELLVEVDPARLAASGLTPADLARALERGDSKAPAGTLRGARSELVFEVHGGFEDLDRVRNLPVHEGAGGRFLRVGDLASVTKAERDPERGRAIVSGRPGVVVAARMQNGQRVDRWAARAKDLVARFEAELPRGVHTTMLFDQARYTEQRLGSLVGNFALGALLVVLVVLVMMGWRAALLVGSALPLASLMVLAGMRWMGIPLHQMSVAGLIIALGLLIDNAIVMVDEMRHHLHEGHSPVEAMGRAVRGLAVPLLGSTVTTALAFMPIVLMPGGAGEFVGPIALSVILAIVSSLFLALTVTPALTGLFERGQDRGTHWWSRGLHLPRLTGLFARYLRVQTAHPLLGVAVALVLPLLGFANAGRLEEQFFPPADRDQFSVELHLAPHASLERTQVAFDRARAVLLAHERVQAVHGFLGESAPKFYYNFVEGTREAPDFAQLLVQLDGPHDSIGVVRELQRSLDAALPDVMVLARQIEQGPPFEAPVEYHVYGHDPAELRRLGESLRERLAAIPDVVHARALLEGGRPKVQVELDEESARLAGLDNADVAARLSGSLDGSFGGSLLEGTEELPVRVRLADGARDDLERVTTLELATAGGWAPLSALAELDLVPELAGISRRDGQRVNTVQAFVTAGVLPSRVLAALERSLQEDPLDLPPGYRLAVGGEAAERDDAVGGLLSTVGVLMVLMAAALVLSFDSFRMAGLIGVVGLLSVGLALGALVVFGLPFGFMAIIGTMGLIGVAINDSIVVLAALREDEAARQRDPEAVVRVVLRSSRHVLSTSLTTMAGFAPLILGGGGFWPPMAVAIAGGVAGATVIALTLVPSGFLWLGCRRTRDPRTRPEQPAATPGTGTLVIG